MISRDYTKEVGIPSHKKTMPRPLAFVVLAIVAVGVSFGVAGVIDASKHRHAAEKAGHAPAAPAAAATAPTPETAAPAPAK